MKKIGILAFANKNSGGVYQYTQSIIDALKEDKQKEYIIFCNDNDKTFEDYGLKVIKINKTQANKFIKILRLFQLLLFIRKPLFFNKNELTIYQDIDFFILPIPSIYPHFYLNKPFIFTLHDMQERYYPSFFSLYERIIRRLINRALVRNAERIICESKLVKKDIVNFLGVNDDLVNIIQSPPPKKFLNYRFNDNQFIKVRKKYHLPENYLLYPAHCWEHKNHIKLIEAFKIVTQQIDNIHLILTGSQKDNYINIINTIDKLNLNNNVHHLGYIDYDDIPYLYKMSKMLVMPTLFESVSIPIYEAFALKIAVCSSNAVALPEQVGDAGLIFDPNNVKDIANKIMMYLNDEELLNLKAYLGFKKVENFNHKEYKNKLLTILNKYV